MSLRMRGIAAAAALQMFAVVPSVALTQADLDEPLANFMIGPKGDFVSVCRALHTGCGIETVAGVEARPAFNSPLPRAGRTAREILDEYIAANPHDEWALVDGVLNLRPALRPSPDLLARRTGNVAFKKADGFETAVAIVRLTRSGIGLVSYDPPALMKSVDHAFKDVTVRQALNWIAKEDGEFVWTVYYSKLPNRFTFRVISFRQRPAGILNPEPEALRVGERAVR